MVEKDDWRLLMDVEYLHDKEINPTDGEEIARHAPYLKRCEFCLDMVRDNPHQWWFIPEDMSCCICEKCFHDFKEMFHWRKLDGWDIDWTMRCPKCRMKLTVIADQDYVYLCEKCNTLYSEEFDDELDLNEIISERGASDNG